MNFVNNFYNSTEGSEDRRDGKRGVEYCIFWMAYYTNGVVVVAGAIELLLG